MVTHGYIVHLIFCSELLLWFTEKIGKKENS
jgi:hypothetical protein